MDRKEVTQKRKTPAPLKNGLTPEQVEKAKEKLRKVNISEVCRKVKVSVATINNVLRDQSPRVEDLRKVLIEADRVIKKKETAINALPL